MINRSTTALVLVLLGCSGAPVAGAPRDPPVPSASEPASADPECDPSARPPVLTSYDAITDGVRFSLAILRDERGVWVPASQLEMPMHHASMIEWQGRELLESHAGATVVVIATGLGRTSIEHDVDRSTWFATYGARIEHVCR